MNSNKSLRRFTGAQKMAVIMMHLKEKKPVSAVCAEANIAPSQFYHWQNELFDRGQKVFEPGEQANKKLQAEIDELKKQLAYKTQVLFELMEEHVKTKKKLGLS